MSFCRKSPSGNTPPKDKNIAFETLSVLRWWKLQRNLFLNTNYMNGSKLVDCLSFTSFIASNFAPATTTRNYYGDGGCGGHV